MKIKTKIIHIIQNISLVHIFQFALLVITAVVFVVNYTPGTYLTGWDNLQTELNPALGIKRAFHSVWQENQSFGLVAGNAHAADLVRSIVVWVLSYILPQDMIRYFFHTLMLGIGGLGAYFLFFSLQLSPLAAFVGSVFYMFNLGTIQLFALPFEPFSIFFAALPYLLLTLHNVLIRGKRRDFFVFMGVNILATPSFFIQTMFIVYGIAIALWFIGCLFQASYDKRKLVSKRFLFVLLLVFLVNAYWILPQVYFFINRGNVVFEAKINFLGTDSLYYKNLAKGTLDNFLTFKGFYYDLVNSTGNKVFYAWRIHEKNILVQFSFIAFFVVGVVGGIFVKHKHKIQFMLLFFLSAVMLATQTFPFSFINIVFRKSTLFNQIFRTPFTKFIVVEAISISFFFALGVDFIIRKTKLWFYRVAVSLFLIISLFFLVQPVFRGNLYAQSMRVAIPKEYHALFSFFSSQPQNARIALLPEQTFWGWYKYSWGYDGSGFLWYGIKQPIVSRTFDVWSSESEGYYYELKSALSQENPDMLLSVLRKYDISFIVFDKSRLPVDTDYKAMQTEQTERLLSKINQIKKVAIFNWITVYQVQNISTGILNVANPVVAYPRASLMSRDPVFYIYNHYIVSGNGSKVNIAAPFMSLQSFNPKKDKSIQITQQKYNFVLSMPFIKNVVFKDKIKSVFIRKAEFISSVVKIHASNGTIKARVPVFLIDSKKFKTIEQCNGSSKSNKTNIWIKRRINNTVLGAKNGASLCSSVLFDDVSLRYGYMIKLFVVNTDNIAPSFYIKEETKQQPFIQGILTNGINYIFIPSIYKYGRGLNFVIQTNSFKGLKTENIIGDIQLFHFPVNNLQSYLLNSGNRKPGNTSALVSVLHSTKKAYWLYEVNNIEKGGVLVLTQAYDKGWRAVSVDNKYFFPLVVLRSIFKDDLEHVVISNWANGWIIPKSREFKKIVIIYLPQFLEYTGFLLLILGIWLTARIKRI